MKRIVLSLCLLAAMASAKPNIILINVDDLGTMDVDYHSDRYITPNVRKICGQGMVFSDAYSAAAQGVPSRASIMSGQYAPRHGIYTSGDPAEGDTQHRKLIPSETAKFLPLENVTIAEALKKGGYKTIHIGKWNLGEDPTEQGFDTNIGGDASGIPEGGYFVPFTGGVMAEYNDQYKKGTHLVDVLTDQAVKYMQINREEPFFMNLCFYSVHEPLVSVPWLVSKYDVSTVNPKFASMVEMMDQGVGRIVDAVYKLRLQNNTIIVFMGDNGGVKHISDQAPFRSGKGSYFDGGLRIPFIIAWPGHSSKAALCEIPVTGVDLYPTFLDAAGIKPPEGKVLDGVSLMPLLKKRATIPERPIFWHFPIYTETNTGKDDDAHDEHFLTRPGSAIRLGRWKLHHYFEDGRIELYDLAGDPAERMNFQHLHTRTRDKMLAMLNEWRESTGAPIPSELNPEYQPPAE